MQKDQSDKEGKIIPGKKKPPSKLPSRHYLDAQPLPISHYWPWWKKLLAFIGPGYMVAVGYVDPGNWATDLAGGSKFGYSLLSVLLLSNLMAILLQFLTCKLGIVTERDLAQSCREHFSYPTTIFLWIVNEIAIIATDLAELIGAAIAFKLLFDIPIIIGVCITALDVFIIAYLQRLGFRYLESFVIFLLIIIGGCFWYEIFYSEPDLTSILSGFLIPRELFSNEEMLYISIGIMGAVIMPHNLFLHSALVRTRKYKEDGPSKKDAIKYTTIDSTIALTFVFFINCAILIMAASVFHKHGYNEVKEIQEAYLLLTPLVNAPLAGTLFAIALLASGQNSTLVGTLAGQVVMEGFLNIRLKPWVRRIITRGLALIPAVFCVIYFGDAALGKLLIFSQVVLSLTLSFALVPLVIFTNSKKKMGEFANSLKIKILAWSSAFLIITLNIKYVFDFIKSILKVF